MLTPESEAIVAEAPPAYTLTYTVVHSAQTMREAEGAAKQRLTDDGTRGLETIQNQ